MISNSLYSPLTHLCNLSISMGFSSRIHNGECHTSKSDYPCVFNHYRPVSLLSVLLKVFEKVFMYNCLINYIDTYMIYFFSINLVLEKCIPNACHLWYLWINRLNQRILVYVLLKFILMSPETAVAGHKTQPLGPELFPQSCARLLDAASRVLIRHMVGCGNTNRTVFSEKFYVEIINRLSKHNKSYVIWSRITRRLS